MSISFLTSETIGIGTIGALRLLEKANKEDLDPIANFLEEAFPNGTLALSRV